MLAKKKYSKLPPIRSTAYKICGHRPNWLFTYKVCGHRSFQGLLTYKVSALHIFHTPQHLLFCSTFKKSRQDYGQRNSVITSCPYIWPFFSLQHPLLSSSCVNVGFYWCSHSLCCFHSILCFLLQPHSRCLRSHWPIHRSLTHSRLPT